MDPSTQSSEHLPPFNDMEKSAEKQDTSVIVDPLEVPNGGTVAWMTLVGAFLAVFCSSGYVNVYGIYEDFFVREYLSESSSFQISWIGSVQVLFLGCSGIPGGYAMDHGYLWPLGHAIRFSSPHVLLVIFCRSSILAVCFFQLDFHATHKMFLLTSDLLHGISMYQPLAYLLTLRTRSLLDSHKPAPPCGLVHPIMLNNLFHGRLGFAWGVRVSALFNLVLLIIANLLMTTRLPARPKDTTFNKQIMYWKSFFTDKVYVLATLSIFILYCGVYFPTFFSNSTQWRMITLLNGVGVLGRIMPTIIVDHVGVFNIMIPCALACGVLIFSWVAMKDAAGVISMAVFYGFFAGAVISLVGPMIAYLTPNHYPRPPNSFILFRQEYARLYAGSKTLQSNVSKSAGEAWRALSDEDKQYYKALAAVEKEKHAKKYSDYRFRPQKKEVKEDTTRTIETTVDSQQAWTYGHYHLALYETTPLPQPGPSAQQMDAGHVTPYFPETYWPSSPPPAHDIHQPLQVPQTCNKTFEDFGYVQFFGILLPPIQPFEW
ncbi:hypothetical protein CPB85DRAFT_1438453 [Mucidula mucida]|nr:hypothetical protein CPB85DRAFT_1438453 [Mucidula mucida]